MQGYAYILTHPGTPSVFYDHIFSHNKSEISALISVRNRNKINCRSTVSFIYFAARFPLDCTEILFLLNVGTFLLSVTRGNAHAQCVWNNSIFVDVKTFKTSLYNVKGFLQPKISFCFGCVRIGRGDDGTKRNLNHSNESL